MEIRPWIELPTRHLACRFCSHQGVEAHCVMWKLGRMTNVMSIVLTLALLEACSCVDHGSFHNFDYEDIEQLDEISDDFNARAKAATASGANITRDTHPKRLLEEVQKSIRASGDLASWLDEFLSDDVQQIQQDAMGAVIDVYTLNEKIVFGQLLELSELFRRGKTPPYKKVLDIVKRIEDASKNVHLITAVLFMNLDELKPLLLPLSKSNVIASMPLQDRYYKKFVQCVMKANSTKKLEPCFKL